MQSRFQCRPFLTHVLLLFSQVVVRVHDACFTSEVLGSLKCDCKEQLQLSLDYIQDQPPGMVIYLQQEGRGIGLANKIAAYALQEQGLDTVDANRALGLPDDCREYTAVSHILQELGIKSIKLMTNNPRKITELSALGITVVDRVPCQVKSQKYNRGYLNAKQQRMKHILRDEEEELEGQYCFWDHDGEPGSAGIPLEPEALPLDAMEMTEPAVAAVAAAVAESGKVVMGMQAVRRATAAAAAAAAASSSSSKLESSELSSSSSSSSSTRTPLDFECGGSAGKPGKSN